MNYTLFDYQKRFCRAVAEAFERPQPDGQGPFNALLGVAATGAGKTTMASALTEFWIEKRNGRVLFLADTDELVEQARDEMIEAASIIPSVEKADSHGNLQSRCVVGSIQTMANAARLAEWPADHFTHVIADEAHLSLAESWQTVLKYFMSGGAKVLGITATPERGDGQAMGKFYEHVAAEVGLFELIESGHLKPIKVITCPIEIDCRTLKANRKGEFNEKAVTSALEPYLHAVIDQWELHCRDRKTIFFHPSVQLSKEFAALLQQRGHAAEHVDGKDPQRREKIQGYKDGKFKIINNAQLLMKGFNVKDISCVVILRITKSRVAFQQMIGRGTRLFPGIDDCIVLDFLWQFEDLGVQRPASLLSRDGEEEQLMQRRMNRWAAEGRTDAVDLREVQSASEAEKIEMLVERFKKAVQGGRRAFDYREMGAMLYQPDLIAYQAVSQWEQMPPTEKQLQALEGRGVSRRSVKSRGLAAKLMDVIDGRSKQDLATVKQVRTLISFDVPEQEARTMTFKEASARLDQLFSAR